MQISRSVIKPDQFAFFFFFASPYYSFLGLGFRATFHFGPLSSVGADLITLDVDVVSWRVPTSSDGCAVL